MPSRFRTTLRALLASATILAAVVLVHSFAATTGVALLAADASVPAGPTGVPGFEAGGPGGPGGPPDDARPVDVESAFADARAGPPPQSNWTAERVAAATDGRRNLTVVSTQGPVVSDERAELAAVLPDGRVVYYEDDNPVYFDVDPVPGERYTVEYVTAEHLHGPHCAEFANNACTRNAVERVNLTTGETETVYADETGRIYSSRWHDVDRLNETTLVIADIANDDVYAVDTRDGSVRWRWNASDHYDRDQGGAPGDWTHVNDVELLDDGRVMVSVRNMDSVVFLNATDGERTVDESWTLGSDGDYDTLHEQHNPDYIPAERGGPAVVVADSEGGRLVEYGREDGAWERRWSWRDARLQWPRDADRLPNGHTLAVDTHGDRIVELGPNDRVVWAARVGMPYDVERLGTGDESAGGPAKTPESSAAAESRPPIDRLWIAAKDATPGLVANGLLYLAPAWVKFPDLAFAALFVLSGGSWALLEVSWSRRRIRDLPGLGAGAVLSLSREIGRRLSRF